MVSDNITVRHLLNVKRLAYEVRRPPAEARAGARGLRPAEVSASEFDAALIARVVREVLASANNGGVRR